MTRAALEPGPGRRPGRLCGLLAVFWLAIGAAPIAGCLNSLPDTRSLIHVALADSQRKEIAAKRDGLERSDDSEATGAKAGGKGTGDARLQRFVRIEKAVTGSVLTAGNKVVLLENGPAAYKAMFAAMSGAKDSINLETFIFRDDEVGHKFAALMVQARRRGVVVNVIYDSFGSMAAPQQFFQHLRDVGVHVLEFNPVDPLTAKRSWTLVNRDHRKLLIVDGKTAFTGGINITADYERGISGRPRGVGVPSMWRDTDVEIQGPAVADLQRLFVDHWVKQTGDLLSNANYFPDEDTPGKMRVRVIGSSQDAGFSQIYVTLIAAIRHARRNVYITTAYFAPDPQLLRALDRAAGRGVDVELILPRHSDYAVARYAAQTHYEDLLEANVKIYERNDVILHAKTVTVDGVWSSVGSTNLDWLSFASDDEINVTVLDPGFARELEQAFASDREQSAQITRGHWAHRSIQVRIRDWMASYVQRWL
jgi:cardiolipin synthase A/B